jgi:phosphoribosylformimino-5-aminoimidazole carboxamide ribotide isomerase
VIPQTFEVIPAIDVLGGRAVRLRAGRREDVTLDGGNPLELARRFVDGGATRLHVVDLDGAFTGAPSAGVRERLLAAGVPVQIGGGYRTTTDVAGALSAGVDRVMVGTAAVRPLVLRELVELAGDRLVVAVDVKDGRVAVSGWTATADVAPDELAHQCAAAGVARFLVTSTARDGTLTGPDLDVLGAVVPVGPPVLAAGGVASVDDLRSLRDAGCEGAVVGSALLSGRFGLAEALASVAR